MDYEIAAINISVNNQTVDVVKDKNPNDDDLPAFAWHRDSYPFVCVTMLSDCTGMIGGETALKTASGEIRKVRGPAMVCLLSPCLSDIFSSSSYRFEPNKLLKNNRELLSSCKEDILNIRRSRLLGVASVSA
jgi:hypothetical protein